jgi:hypothetical protein
MQRKMKHLIGLKMFEFAVLCLLPLCFDANYPTPENRFGREKGDVQRNTNNLRVSTLNFRQTDVKGKKVSMFLFERISEKNTDKFSVCGRLKMIPKS